MTTNDCELKIHLILEGNEEEMFFTIIKDSKIKCKEIDLSFKNAGGACNIAKHYQTAINQDDYDLVLCVFDGDYKTNDKKSTYSKTIDKLEMVIGNKDKAKLVSLISNPNILLWILLGVGNLNDLKELKVNKEDNTELLHKYFPSIGESYCKGNKGGKVYAAEKWQLDTIKFHFEGKEDCIDRLIENIDKVPEQIKDTEPSSNLANFLKSLHSVSEMKQYINSKDIFKEE